MTDYNKHHSDGPRRKLILGATVVALGGLYVLHRRRLDAVITMMETLSQAAVQETMWKSFDEGVKYGLTLEKTVHIVKDGAGYAFDAFDKAS